MSNIDTNATQAPPSEGAPAAYVQPPKIRLDKGRSFSTVHGARPPGDLHVNVHYTQDGLYYDAGGVLILEHPDYYADSADAALMRRKLEKKLKQHMVKASRQPAVALTRRGERNIDEVDDDNAEDTADGKMEDEEGEEEQEAINLSSWMRGEQQVEWQDVTQEIARRYKKRIGSIADAIPFLVQQNVCSPPEVAKKFKKFLD